MRTVAKLNQTAIPGVPWFLQRRLEKTENFQMALIGQANRANRYRGTVFSFQFSVFSFQNGENSLVPRPACREEQRFSKNGSPPGLGRLVVRLSRLHKMLWI